MSFIPFLSIVIGHAYLLTALVLFHRVMPQWRDINRFAALCVWALGLATGWFGTILIAEGLHYGDPPEVRLGAHSLMLIGLWLGIAAQVHFGHHTNTKGDEL